MKVKIVSDCKVNGEVLAVGDVVDVDKEARLLLVGQNQAIDVVEKEEAKPDETVGGKPKTKKELAAEKKLAAAESKSTDPSPGDGDGNQGTGEGENE